MELECKVCHYKWLPRKAEAPKLCPNCGSRFWAVGRQRASRKKSPEFVTDILPLSHELRDEGLARLGLLQPLTGEQMLLGVTNAGPWHDMTDREPVPTNMLDLLEYQNGEDGLWVVSECEDNGECLIGDDIYPGDVIHFRKGLVPENGEIVLAMGHDLYGRFFVTAKHWYQTGISEDGRPVVELRPSNPDCPTIRAFPFNVHVEAVSVNVIRRGRHRRMNSKILETRRTMAEKREQVVSPIKGKKKA